MFVSEGLITILLSIGVVFAQVAVVFLVVHQLFFRQKPCKLVSFAKQKALVLSFLVALVGTIGSLYYSEIVGYVPCNLCWFQRIFLYPQVVILGWALWKKKTEFVAESILPLSWLGLFFSLYYAFIYYTGNSSAFCPVLSPCTKKYFTVFGYITFPVMAITSFLLIGTPLILRKRSD